MVYLRQAAQLAQKLFLLSNDIIRGQCMHHGALHILLLLKPHPTAALNFAAVIIHHVCTHGRQTGWDFNK